MGDIFASRSHRDNVAGWTSTSADSAVADLAPGPVIFSIIFSLNFNEYGMGYRPFAPPGMASGHAATILTPGAGRTVDVARSFVDPRKAPWVEHEGQRLPLSPVDPTANGKRKRPHRAPRGIDAVDFKPADALLDKSVGRPPKGGR
ncbi:MAG: hypothetical protein JRH11_11170 [Deltaproteobacteria bacterium]|nr:hypothetical protein [Deltaproteobacteria bacterium]